MDQEASLLRSNSMSSKMTTFYFHLHGKQYLQDVLRPLIQWVCSLNEDLEVNPTNTDPSQAAAHIHTLVQHCERFLQAILSSLPVVPVGMRYVASELWKAVATRFPKSTHIAVGALLFLRFLCPAIATPTTNGIIDKLTPLATRSLVLISKVLQSAANMVVIPDKESYMQAFNPFIELHRQDLISFFTSFAEVKGLDPIPPLQVQSSQKAAYIQVLVDHLSKHREALAHLIPSSIMPLLLTTPPTPARQPLTRSQTMNEPSEPTPGGKPRSFTSESPRTPITRSNTLFPSLSENDIEPSPLPAPKPTAKQLKMLQKSISERFARDEDDNIILNDDALANLQIPEDLMHIKKKKNPKTVESTLVHANRRFEMALEHIDLGGGEKERRRRSPDVHRSERDRDRAHTHTAVPEREKIHNHNHRPPSLTEHKRNARLSLMRESTGGKYRDDDTPDFDSCRRDNHDKRRSYHEDNNKEDDHHHRPKSLQIHKPLVISSLEESTKASRHKSLSTE